MKVLFSYEEPTPSFLYKAKIHIDHSVWVDGTLYVNRLNWNYAKTYYKGRIKPIEELKNDLSGTIETPFREITASSLEFLKKHGTIKDISEELLLERMRKTSKEMKLIEEANKISFDILKRLRVQKDEISTYYHLKQLILSQKLEPSFDPIVASVENARFPHYKAQRSEIKNGYLVDFGINYGTYVSDITEMKSLKKPSHKNLYNKLKKAFYKILDSIYPGMLAKELHFNYLKIFKSLGLPEMPHLIGHGIGIEVHEYPSITPKSEHVLENVAIAIEPAYYGTFGLRFERNILIKKRTVKCLE